MTSSDEIPIGAHLNLTEFNPYYNQQCRPMNLSQQRGVDWDSYVKNQPLFEVFRKKIRAFSSQKTIKCVQLLYREIKILFGCGFPVSILPTEHPERSKIPLTFLQRSCE